MTVKDVKGCQIKTCTRRAWLLSSEDSLSSHTTSCYNGHVIKNCYRSFGSRRATRLNNVTAGFRTLHLPHGKGMVATSHYTSSLLITVQQHYIPALEHPLYNCLMEIYVFFSLDPIICHLWHDLSEND